MPKDSGRTLFFCTQCGHESPKWMGFCPSCGQRVPLEEAPAARPGPSRGWLAAPATEPQELAHVTTDDGVRLSLHSQELNRVLGGGVVFGSLVLMAGEPGIGKSTLMLQAAQHVADQGQRVLYISGEESDRQIALRSQRLGLSGHGVYLLPETDVDQVIQQLEQYRPFLVMVDSIQALSTAELPSGAGTVPQVRECTLRLMRWAKSRGTPLLLTGHVTKDGTVAGPRVLEHMVDVVLYLEGENLGTYRVLRSIKNRFGSTNEVGVFQMSANGLEEVLDPSQALLAERDPEAVGSAIVPVVEGSRPLLVELQALTAPSLLAVPRRTANGMDFNRVLMIAAVLSRRARLSLANQDIIVNVVGGLRVTEPGADLGLALAIGSSLRNQPLRREMVAVGEVGLSGELRSVSHLARRLSEAARLGFSCCLLPTSARGQVPPMDGLKLIYAATVGQALALGMERESKGHEEAPVIDDLSDTSPR